MNADTLRKKFDEGLDYDAYLDSGKPDQKQRWLELAENVDLTEAQAAMLGAFTRDLNVLVVTGIWCGDCVRQGPMIDEIAKAYGKTGGGRCTVKWFDRDEHMDLQEQVTVNGGNRVPVVIFAAEDYEPVGWAGDKLLSRYRVMAQQALGANCPLPGAPVPPDELAAELADWVGEFERVALLLRLSGRLRQKHGD